MDTPGGGIGQAGEPLVRYVFLRSTEARQQLLKGDTEAGAGLPSPSCG